MKSALRIGTLVVALATLFAAPARAGIRDVARKTAAEKGKAVLTIEVVHSVKYSFSGDSNESEEKSEAIGVVLDGTGLVLTSLSNIDPAAVYQRLNNDQAEQMNFTTTVKTIKYILDDNTEIEATVVLRDNDLDLAFLRPLQPPATPMVSIDITKSIEPNLVDEAFTIARTGKISKRSLLCMTGEIQGIVTKPRTYYIPHAELTSGGTGSPVFGADGTVIGVVLLHVMPSAGSSERDEQVIPVVIPASEIQEIAAQAPANAQVTAAAPAAAPAEAQEAAPPAKE
ncbi:trypsin-like peptidase domain-containing protein [Candidatus Poribacteria bacterium]|nr:trypsin-like peptidase domain-containing protein [Candidatus Poribacteria bacterium]